MANITEQTIKLMESDDYYINLYNDYMNEATREAATYISIVSFKDGKYLNKNFKAPKKKEITCNYLHNIIHKDNVYLNFCNDFKRLLPAKYQNSIDVYPTSYGIGIFVLFSWQSETSKIKKEIENTLKKYDIQYKNEFSDAGWVFRYKISKSEANIKKIESI